jgi:hypothetical protein
METRSPVRGDLPDRCEHRGDGGAARLTSPLGSPAILPQIACQSPVNGDQLASFHGDTSQSDDILSEYFQNPVIHSHSGIHTDPHSQFPYASVKFSDKLS